MKLQIKGKVYCLILIVSLLIIILSLYFFYKPFNEASKQTVQTESLSEYVIGVYEEKIAVFTQGDSLPIEIFDVYVSTLPVIDQKALLKGIKIKGKAELRQRIEDFTS